MDGAMTVPDDVRERMIRAEEARREAEEKAREDREAARVAAEEAELTRRVRSAYPGTDEQFALEGPDLLKAERARITAERDAAARRENAARYQ